jgi:hypothetical protein
MVSFGGGVTNGVVILGVNLLASVNGVPSLVLASFAVRSRRRDEESRDAQRRFSVLSNGIPKLIFAKYDVCWRFRHD